MNAIKPVLPFSEPLEINVAENQPEYPTLPVFRTQYTSISRWKLSNEERKYLAEGGDLFIGQLNGSAQLQPIMPMASPEDTILGIVLEVEKGLGLE